MKGRKIENINFCHKDIFNGTGLYLIRRERTFLILYLLFYLFILRCYERNIFVQIELKEKYGEIQFLKCFIRKQIFIFLEFCFQVSVS